MDEYIAAAGESAPQALRKCRETSARIESEMFRRKGPSRVLIGMCLPANFRVVESDARALARLSGARLALGCKLHRLKTGQWPQSLADLQKAFPERFKELPNDPFTGQPFVYKLTDKGCLVYSVGPDGKDDGGAAYDSKTRAVNYDLVFELKK